MNVEPESSLANFIGSVTLLASFENDIGMSHHIHLERSVVADKLMTASKFLLS
jgi:hypothetical protein